MKPQIRLTLALALAIVAGNAIVLVGARASGLSSVIRQANMAGLLLMEGVSRLVPFFAAALPISWP